MIKKIILGVICLGIAFTLFVLVFNNMPETPVQSVYVQRGDFVEEDLFKGLESHLNLKKLYIKKVGKDNPFK